jgi:hypothetical protein
MGRAVGAYDEFILWWPGFWATNDLGNGSHVEDDVAYLIYEMDHVDD